MKSYLVDFENVKSKGLAGIDKLDEDDHVIIFYSENSDTISFDMHCLVMRSKASVEYMKVKVGGKNALDFQLSTLLGYMVAKELNTHIFIISNDKGFDRLHDFWQNTFDDSPVCVVFRTANIISAINFAKYNTKRALSFAENKDAQPDRAEEAMTYEPAEEEKPVIIAETIDEEKISQAAQSAADEAANVSNASAIMIDDVQIKIEKIKSLESKESAEVQPEQTVAQAEPSAPAVKKQTRRGRPRKNPVAATNADSSAEGKAETPVKKPGKRGRPRKNPIASESAAKSASKRKTTKKSGDKPNEPENTAVQSTEGTAEQ